MRGRPDVPDIGAPSHRPDLADPGGAEGGRHRAVLALAVFEYVESPAAVRPRTR